MTPPSPLGAGLEIDVTLAAGPARGAAGARPAFQLDARFTAPARGLTALFGPSGAGKSSLLALVAGLRRPTRGRIALDGQVLFDDRAGIDLPPERRGIGYVFQDALLFPHLTVRANLRYGIRRMAAAEADAMQDRLVRLLDIGHLLHRRPPSLSGGERQRVAIGRALLSGPRLLLMDEPLAALDNARKAEILPYIEAVRDQWQVPILYVSHALPEILRLANHAVRLDRGRVVAAGMLAEVLTPDAATGGQPCGDPLGEPAAVLDMLTDPADDDATLAADGLIRLTLPGGGPAATLLVVPPAPAPGANPDPGSNWGSSPVSGGGTTRYRVRIAASDVALARQPPDGLSIQNILPATITAITPAPGHPALLDVLLTIAGGAKGGSGAGIGVEADSAPPHRLWARITRHAQRHLALRVGEEVCALVKAARLDDAGVARLPGRLPSRCLPSR